MRPKHGLPTLELRLMMDPSFACRLWHKYRRFSLALVQIPVSLPPAFLPALQHH